MVVMLLLAGCAHTPPGLLEASFDSHNQQKLFEVDPSFVVGLNVLSVNQPETGGTWETEDWMLLGVKVTRGESQDLWLVRLSSLRPQDPDHEPESREFAVPFGMGGVKTGAKFTAPVGKLLVELFDKDGRPQRSSVRTIPQVQSTANLLDVLSTASPGRHEQSLTSNDEIAKAITVIQMMGGARALFPIREAIKDHVVKRPSILAIMLSGFRLKLEARFDRQHSTLSSDVEPPHIQRQEAKFPLMLSGHRLFDCRVVTGATKAPFNLTAGALMVEAVNPQESTHRLTVSVLAAKQSGAAAERFAKK